jgi:hypothetical protein
MADHGSRRKPQADAGDRSEALAHSHLARALAKSSGDLRVPTPGQARKLAILGSLDHMTRQLVVHTETGRMRQQRAS